MTIATELVALVDITYPLAPLTITVEDDPLPVPEWLVRELQCHVLLEPTHGGRVFSTAEGDPVDAATFRAAWREAAQEAGLGHLDVGAI